MAQIWVRQDKILDFRDSMSTLSRQHLIQHEEVDANPETCKDERVSRRSIALVQPLQLARFRIHVDNRMC